MFSHWTMGWWWKMIGGAPIKNGYRNRGAVCRDHFQNSNCWREKKTISRGESQIQFSSWWFVLRVHFHLCRVPFYGSVFANLGAEPLFSSFGSLNGQVEKLSVHPFWNLYHWMQISREPNTAKKEKNECFDRHALAICWTEKGFRFNASVDWCNSRFNFPREKNIWF